MADQASGFAAAAASVRDSAKWLLAVAAAVGAILVGGLQVSGVAKLPDDVLPWALGAAAIGLAGVAWAVTGVGNLLLPRSFTMRELASANRGRAADLRRELEARKELLGGWDTCAALASALDTATSRYQGALEAWAAATDPDAKKVARSVLDDTTAVLNHVSSVTRDAGDWANYLSLRNDYGSVIGHRVLPGVGFALVGLVTVMLLTARAETQDTLNLSGAQFSPGTSLDHARLAGADFSNATISGVSFAFSDLSNATLAKANASGADFRAANLKDANLDGADLSNARWDHTICPDGVNSDDVGGSCDAHRAAGEAPNPS